MNWALLQNSFSVGASTAIVSVGFGFVSALWLAGLPARWRTVFLSAAILALALPPFLVTNCWLHFLGHTGVWHNWLPLNIFSLGGTVWVLSLLLWPLSLLLVWAAWQRLEPSQLESDMMVTGWALLRALLLPLARSALAQAAVLTFVLALNNFAVPAILQVKVFPAEMWIRFNTTLKTLDALQLSWPIVAGPLLLVLWLSKRQFPWPHLEPAVPARLFRQQLGPAWFWSSGACAMLICICSVALPLFQILSVRRTWTELPGAIAAGQTAIWNSFWYAAAAATIVIVVSLIMVTPAEIRRPKAEGRRKSEIRSPNRLCVFSSHCSPAGRFAEAAGIRLLGFGFRPSAFGPRISGLTAWLAFLLPGVLLGIGLIHVFNHAWSARFYQSAGIVILAFVIRYLVIGWYATSHAALRVDRDLIDVARLEGATNWQMLRYVQWPQIARPILVAWYIVFVLCLWDVESMILVVPPGGETLALRIFNLLHYGHNAQVNALCLVLLGVALGPLVVGTLWGWAKGESVNPKAEIRIPREGRNPKSESVVRRSIATCCGKPRFSRHRLHVFQVSAFGFRISFGLRPLAALSRRRSGSAFGFSRLLLLSSACASLLLTSCGPSSSQLPLHSTLFGRVEIIGSRGVGVGQLNKPRSVAVDASDNLYVVDMTGRVQKFSSNGVFLLSWQMPQTDLGKPKGMCRDRDGNILVVEPHYSRVNTFSPLGELIAQWGRHGTNEGQLSLPRAVAVNSHNELFVSEYQEAERVQKFALTSSRSETETGTARAASHPASWILHPPTSIPPRWVCSIGQAGTGPGEFNRPEGLCVDAQDRLYVADSCNHRIEVFSSEGRLLRTYGKPGKGSGELSYPYDICVDNEGRQYVCEFGNSRIQVFDAHDKPMEIIGGPGAEPGMFSNPWGVALDSAGNLYVADSQNHRVQKLVRGQ